MHHPGDIQCWRATAAVPVLLKRPRRRARSSDAKSRLELQSRTRFMSPGRSLDGDAQRDRSACLMSTMGSHGSGAPAAHVRETRIKSSTWRGFIIRLAAVMRSANSKSERWILGIVCPRVRDLASHDSFPLSCLHQPCPRIQGGMSDPSPGFFYHTARETARH